MPLQMRRGEPNRKANIYTARFIPLFLVGIIGYSTWVLTDLVTIRYLLRPEPSLRLPKRTGSAIAILVTFYILLSILLISYARLVQTVITNPGLVPRGPQYFVEQERKAREAKAQTEKETADDASNEGWGKLPKDRNASDEEALRVQDFWHKDVFVVKYDGRPAFCSHCYNYKPTRSHHCSELNRCVYKMDHFCPWVGGIISENSFKYFIIFTGWTACFTLHVLVVMAYFYAERRRTEHGFVNVNWILALSFAALFFVFGSGMCISSLQFALFNTTTIENIDRRSHVYYLAVHVPESVLARYHASGRSDLRLITYPRPPEEELQILRETGASMPPDTTSSTGQTSQPSQSTDISHQATKPPQSPRTFAILESKPGQTPFDIGYLNNLREVLGYTIWDWFLPIRPSPCVKHDDPYCMYKTGSVVFQMRKTAGILEEEEMKRASSTRRKKRRRRSSAAVADSRGEGDRR